jgi:hypothetical protein
VRNIEGVKERLSLSVDSLTAAYLAERAALETNGNVSALVERLVRSAQLVDSVRAEARWYAEHPDYAEAAESERYAS